MAVEAFVPSVNQSFEIGIEEIKVQVVEPLNDGFLNFGIGSEMTACQVLLQLSEEMKITWCEIRAIGRLFRRSALCSSRTSFLHSSNSLHRNPTSFHGITLSYDFSYKCFLQTERFSYTSHFNPRPCIRQRSHLVTEILEHYGTSSLIYMWRWNAMIVYHI
ncbi:hypothetical protein AVEN_165628-1 [Araneus ventricosus]|uniref:Uncharacterized protein n=1 Tax=Araneus ventricosus TaxID=182803 RepID=A0A4Y2IIJ1_ARAVE|nr:hypothetical protein AVEN_165628-1 [Araneus ventricosus]